MVPSVLRYATSDSESDGTMTHPSHWTANHRTIRERSSSLERANNPAGLVKTTINQESLEPVVESASPIIYNTYNLRLKEEESPFLRHWYTVKRSKWTIIACALVITALATIATLKMTPLYESVGRISVQRDSGDTLGLKDFDQGSSTEDWDYNVALDTQVKVLQSDSLALLVVRKLGWDKTPANSGDLTGQTELRGDNKQENELIGRFLAGLSVKVVPGTRIIEVHYLSPDPRMSAEAVNTLINVYIEQNFKSKYESTIRTSQWLQAQLAELQVKVEASQEKLVRYQRESDILGIDEKQNIIVSKLDELNRDLTAAQTDRIQKEATYKLASSGDLSSIARYDANSPIAKLEGQQEDLQLQYAQLRTQFGPSYPKVVELNNQLRQIASSISNEQQRFVTKTAADYRAALAKEQMLRQAFDQQKQEANRLNESAIEYTALKRDADSNRQLYDNLQQRLKEAGVAAGLRSNNINIVDVARVPTYPTKPNIPRNIALGFIFGLLAGFGLVFVRDSMDVTIRDGEQATAITSLPELGIIPLDGESTARTAVAGNVALALRTKGKVEPVLVARPKSQLSECYRALRTSILLSSAGEPPKVLLVTSPLPQEGKSMTSMNVAVALAQKGSRVLVIDADMRRPSLHNVLGQRPKGGLSSVLSGTELLDNCVVSVPQVPTLTLLPAGPIPPQPAELLGSSRMRDLIARWREEYDHVVIDSPPCLSVTDAVLLSVMVDRVVLVIRAGQTTKTALKRTRDLLGQVNANVLGVVLNAMDLRAGSYYYQYSYYYSGKYSGRYYEQSVNE